MDGIQTVAAADASVARLKECMAKLDAECDVTSPRSEPDFVAVTKADMDEATALSREIAEFLDSQRRVSANKDKLKATHREFVEAMKELQVIQRNYARKREELVEYDLIQAAVVSPDDLKRMKDEQVKLAKLVEETGTVHQVFKAVGEVVGSQTTDVLQVQAKAVDLKLQIGRAITEEEQAAYLQWQALKKKCLVMFLLLFIIAGIATPVVLYYVNHKCYFWNRVVQQKSTIGAMSTDGPTLHTVEEALKAVAHMKECLGVVEVGCNASDMPSEAMFISQTKPSMDDATALSRQVANFLEKAKHKHDKEQLKALQKDFVVTMKRLQETQRMHARKHEAVVEYDLIQGGAVTSDEFKAGKDVLEKELALADEMGHLVHAVGQVNKVVLEQTKVIEHVKTELDAVAITIGESVSAEEQAAYLKWENLKKRALITALAVAIAAAIVTPIVLAFT
ncbi:hypothetical protein DYB31_007330 [Aphanomyces astaci]|uniref:t-SNARE coiled-coil homology domain-containing protein n=1 Tax=Aphanomyces astaci TaxID=112090 RepID=A0A397EMD8_APHAT|nr:hypothetical protein DYB31_007330 [Aphanomyces astaci]